MSSSHSIHPYTLSRLTRLALAALLLLGSLACSLPLLEWPFPTAEPVVPGPAGPTATPIPAAQVTFEAVLPAPLLSGETLALSILDDVTGLAFNAVNYPMQARDAQTYSVTLPIADGSVVKYRYLLLSNVQVLEDTSFDQPVRFRLYHVAGPGAVRDLISSWSGQPFSWTTGQVRGQVLNADSGAPLANILVAGGGVQAFTDASGHFTLWGLPPGVHNVAAYAPDGAYATFQQGAQVAADQLTPVELRLKPAPLVNVVFTVSVPRNTVPGAPVRLAGNLLQLGNTFASLNGGLGTVANRMPVLAQLPDGRYNISLSLPAGADLQVHPGGWLLERGT